MDGRLVRGYPLGHYPMGRSTTSISLEGVDSGIYHLRLVSDAGTATGKLVVLRHP